MLRFASKRKKNISENGTPYAEDLADELIGQGLTENNKVYLDLLFNQVYLGTDDDGNRVEPFKDKKKKRKKISGSLGVAAKPIGSGGSWRDCPPSRTPAGLQG